VGDYEKVITLFMPAQEIPPGRGSLAKKGMGGSGRETCQTEDLESSKEETVKSKGERLLTGFFGMGN